MPSKTLDKNTLLVVLYLIERLNGVLGKTHLQKILFLTDLIATKKTDEQITVLDYKKYHYGPFSSELQEYTKELEKKGLVTEKEFPFASDSSKKYTRYYFAKEGTSAKPQLLKSIGNEKIMIIDEIVSSYGNMSLQEVLDIVYKLQLVEKTEKNKPLNMAKGIENTVSEKEEEDIL
jgi:uncharacterized protein YwgA